MIKWGVSAMSHDAALAVYKDDNIVYASHGERYSRVKNDKDLHPDQIKEALEFGEPDEVFFYENTFKKKMRQLSAGQYKLLTKQSPATYMRKLGIEAPVTPIDHHESHAAYGYFTSIFGEADILVIDSIGEFETLSFWKGSGYTMTKVLSQSYPQSVGLWYSAMTQRLGLKPQEHEYILMGMAALGDPSRFYQMIKDDFFLQMPGIDGFNVMFKMNLHKGCQNWRPEIKSIADYVDVAAAVQQLYEEVFTGLLFWMKARSDNTELVLVGGCALNCVANSIAYNFYDDVWIPPNPGDAGSSVGAILANGNAPNRMTHSFFGTDIPGEYPVAAIIADLKEYGIAAVASGRAEFGPRALGHRSILADPRIDDIAARVNQLKQREAFRPFSPMILKEHAGRYFKLPDVDINMSFMQFAIPCLQPHNFPGIVHVDNTSRVQTVDMNYDWDGPDGPRKLLEAWYAETGCPMLLNTSLNIKGEPLVNTREDALRWTQEHNVKVHMPDEKN